MTTTSTPVEFRPVPAQRIAALTRTAAGFGSALIGPVVGPMFPEAAGLLAAAGVRSGAAVAEYVPDDEFVHVTAGFAVEDSVTAVPGLHVRTLPALPRAAVLTHHGAPDGLDAAWTALMDAVRDAGAQASGAGREVYLTPADRPREDWMTELIQPVA